MWPWPLISRRAALNHIWRWINFLSVSVCGVWLPVLLFIGDWNAGRAGPAWWAERWPSTTTIWPRALRPPGPSIITNICKQLSLTSHHLPPPPPATIIMNWNLPGLISRYGSRAARIRTANRHRHRNHSFLNFENFSAEYTKQTQSCSCLLWHDSATFLQQGMRNVELNHHWNVKELGRPNV